MVVNNMSTNKRNFYFARNKKGYLCTYDNNTHLCIGVIESTGDIPLTKEQRDAFIGQIDPKFAK